MPTSLGYQPNYGIGGQQMTSTPGQSLYPEVQATRANAIPSALSKLSTGSSFALQSLKNTIGSIGKKAGEDAAEQAGKQAALKVGSRALGAITAGIGTVYGAADMAMQIASNKDHRSAGQMRDTLSTNTYTTDLGNQYTTHSGVNLGNELDYAKAQRTSRNLNFTAASIGTGMSAGALIGTAIGTSAAPGIGTLVGAGVGALGGGIAYLAGLGDTEEETREAANAVTDSVSMGNRMSKSIAFSQDAKQGFYGRTKSGSLGAANGKRPIHARNGYGNAMVSHGEVIGNLNEGWAYREPGVPDNNDTLKRHIAKDDFVISNKYGLSDYAASTGDLVGALQLQDMLMKYNNGKGYKCGKLPKFEGGYWDKALMAIPNIAQILAATQQYNKDRKMPVEAPRRMADYSSARNQAYALLNNRIDPRPYMRIIDEDTARNKYAITRMPGMGMGGRAVMMDAIGAAGLNAKMKQLLSINEREYEKEKFARNLMATINTHEQDVENQNFADYAHRYAQASGMKYNNLAQDLKSMVTPFGQIIGDWWKYDQYQDAKGLNKDKIGIFYQTANTDKIRALADLYGRTPISGYGAYGTGDWAEENYKLGQAAKRAYNTMNF